MVNFLFKSNLVCFQIYNQNNLEIILKIMKKTWKNHGKVMEFCQSEKVGTLIIGI